MSYASVVAKGGPQDPEEAAAPQLDTVIHETDSVSLVDVDSGVSVVSADFLDQEVKTETQAERLDIEAEVEREEEEARRKASAAKKKVSSKAREAEFDVKEYFKDPVNAGNAVLSTLLVVGFGVAGIRKYRAGELSWKLVGIATAGVAAFSVVDFFATQWANNFFAKKKKN